MTDFPPIYFEWTDDGTFRPASTAFARMCDRHFVVGERYRLMAREERSGVTHRHYFASINKAWKTLPENLQERFPSAEHLRGWALCKAGFCNEEIVACTDKTQAKTFARIIRKRDPYSIISIQQDTIHIFTPHSQSLANANKELFQKQKVAVLHVIDDLLGTDHGTTAKQKESA